MRAVIKNDKHEQMDAKKKKASKPTYCNELSKLNNWMKLPSLESFGKTRGASKLVHGKRQSGWLHSYSLKTTTKKKFKKVRRKTRAIKDIPKFFPIVDLPANFEQILNKKVPLSEMIIPQKKKKY